MPDRDDQNSVPHPEQAEGGTHDEWGRPEAGEGALPGSDPFGELARIVAEEPTAPAPHGFSKPVGSLSESDLARDLETELLNELQASFAALREPLENYQPRVEQTPDVPQWAAPDPVEPEAEMAAGTADEVISEAEEEFALESDESPADEPVAYAEAVPAYEEPAEEPYEPAYADASRYEDSAEEDEAVSDEDFAVEILDGETFISEEEIAQEPDAPAFDFAPDADRDAYPPLEGDRFDILGESERAEPSSYVSADAEDDADPRRTVGWTGIRGSFASMTMRPGEAAEAGETSYTLPAPRRPRWSGASASEDGFPLSGGDARFDDDPFARRDDREDGFVGLDDDDLIDPAPVDLDAEPVEQDFSEALREEEHGSFAPSGPIPGYFDDSDDDQHEQPKRGRRTLVAAGILGLVTVGAAAAFLFRPGAEVGAVNPPVITADNTPTRVQPEATAPGSRDEVGRVVYDRVGAGDAAPNERLGPRSEQPIAIPAIPGPASEASREISRVILPGAPGDASASDRLPTSASPSRRDAIMAEAEQPDAALPEPSAETVDSFAPRRVRTLVVRPDGTVVASESAPSEPAPSNSVPLPPAGSNSAGPSRTISEPGAAAGAPEMLPVPSRGGTSVAAPDGSGPGRADTMQTPPRPVQRPENTTVAIRRPAPQPSAGAPVSLLPGGGGAAAPAAVPAPRDTVIARAPTPAQAARPAAVPSGSFVVQVSAQRSEEAALSTYRNLQGRFPNLFAQRQPLLQRADLGDRGIYYRVRVGPMSTREEAASFCEQFRAVGGDCIIARAE